MSSKCLIIEASRGEIEGKITRLMRDVMCRHNASRERKSTKYNAGEKEEKSHASMPTML